MLTGLRHRAITRIVPSTRKLTIGIVLAVAFVCVLVFSSVFWRSRFNGTVELPVVGVTNINGAECAVLKLPYAIRGDVLRSKLIPKILQPIILYSTAHYECHSFDAEGHRTQEWLAAAPIDPQEIPKGRAFILLPETTNRWQLSIQHTQSLRIANLHLFDLRSGTLVTPLQEPTSPKRQQTAH